MKYKILIFYFLFLILQLELLCLRVNFTDNDDFFIIFINISGPSFNSNYSLYVVDGDCYFYDVSNMTTFSNGTINLGSNVTWPRANCSVLTLSNQSTVGDETLLNFTNILKSATNYTITVFFNGGFWQSQTFLSPVRKSSTVQSGTTSSQTGLTDKLTTTKYDQYVNSSSVQSVTTSSQTEFTNKLTTTKYVPSKILEFECYNATTDSFTCSWKPSGTVNESVTNYLMQCSSKTVIFIASLPLTLRDILVNVDVVANTMYTCTIQPCAVSACGETSTTTVLTPPHRVNVTSIAAAMSSSTQKATSWEIYVVLPYVLVPDSLRSNGNFTLVVVVKNKAVIQNYSSDPVEKTYSECDKGYICPYAIILRPQTRGKRSVPIVNGNDSNVRLEYEEYVIGSDRKCVYGSCNGPLHPATDYEIGFRMCDKDWCTVVVIIKNTIAEKFPDYIVVVIVVLILVIIATIALVCFCRRRSKRSSERNSLISKKDSDSSKVDCFDEYYNNMMRDSCGLASEQFSDVIRKWKELEDQKKLRYVDGNAMKNRYNNIKPYEHNAVKLRVDSDYINASRICPKHCSLERGGQCQCSDYYIATQGPIGNSFEGKLSTIGDFWRMCFEEDVRIIVNLTKCVESYKEKCAQYWPEENTIQSAYLSGNHYVYVTPDKATKNGTFEERTFTMSMNGQEKSITQLHFTAWPDHDCPIIDDFLQFYHRFISRRNDDDTVLVHCSAGVGRTGTFILVDIELRKVVKESSRIEIYNTLLNLRSGRCLMVQTEKQFVFAYDVIHEYLMREGLLAPKTKVRDEIPLDAKNSYLNPAFQ